MSNVRVLSLVAIIGILFAWYGGPPHAADQSWKTRQEPLPDPRVIVEKNDTTEGRILPSMIVRGDGGASARVRQSAAVRDFTRRVEESTRSVWDVKVGFTEDGYVESLEPVFGPDKEVHALHAVVFFPGDPRDAAKIQALNDCYVFPQCSVPGIPHRAEMRLFLKSRDLDEADVLIVLYWVPPVPPVTA